MQRWQLLTLVTPAGTRRTVRVDKPSDARPLQRSGRLRVGNSL